jgi:hypothetical protein
MKKNHSQSSVQYTKDPMMSEVVTTTLKSARDIRNILGKNVRLTGQDRWSVSLVDRVKIIVSSLDDTILQ